jgi:hypothetical protein
MSYDVDLIDVETGEILTMPEAFTDGGTHAIGGTNDCSLNITYNYTEVFGSLVRELDGRTARDTIPLLLDFVYLWPHAKPYSDYWAPTPGNAKAAIERLLMFAAKHPGGIWRVS